MAKIFSLEELVGEISFINTISIGDYIYGDVNFIGTTFLDDIYGEIDFGMETVLQFPYTTGEVNFVDPNYFPGLSVADEEDPLPEELCASFGSNVYVVCPDISSAYPIPGSELLECNIEWDGNTPITGNIRLKNSDRKYTNPTDSSFGGVFTEEEIWSNTKNSRKYLFIENMSKCGDKVSYLLFPRMVITSVSGTHTLTVNFVDEISYYLFYRKVTFPTYCFEEALTRIDSTHYASFTLTEFYYERNGADRQSEFLINSVQKVPSYVNLTDKKVTVGTIENENIPVVLRNPKLVKSLIDSIIKQVIDTQEGLITKEYLQVEMYFTDFFIYNTIEIQNTDIISVLKNNFFDAIPADFYIKPIMHYVPYNTTDRNAEATYLSTCNLKPTLVIQNTLLEDEFYTPTYRIPERMVRGECEPQLTGIKKFNSQKVMKPGILDKRYVLEVNEVELPEEVPTVIPSPPQPVPLILPLNLYPFIPIFLVGDDLQQGTLNDVVYFVSQTQDYYNPYTGETITSSSPDAGKFYMSELFPNGYTGDRSGVYVYGIYMSWVATIYWNQPCYARGVGE